MDIFIVEAADVGELVEVEIGHDGFGPGLKQQKALKYL